MKAKILLIEDDDILGASLSDLLQIESYHVDWITNGQKGLEAALKNIHDLIILDVMLPAKNGLSVLQEIRERSQVPILILSAKASTEDRVQGLKLRADDYLAKPFHLEELLLRVANLLRRSQNTADRFQEIELGACRIDFNSRCLLLANAEAVALSEKEADLLRFLISHAGRYVSRDQILDQVWGAQQHPSPRTVDNFIVKLRKYIEPDPQQPQHLRSQHGVGYGIFL